MSKGVREWMQVELWSSRTNKKIVRIIWFVVVVVGFGLFLLRYWINPLEHQAVVKMLDRAAEIRFASAEDLPKQIALSENDLKVAERYKWSIRDLVVESSGSEAMQMAGLCRRGELKFQSHLEPHESEQVMKLTKFGCEQYEDDVKYSREALRTHLGF